MPRSAWRLQIPIWIARIIVGIGEGVAMIQEEFHRANRNRESKPLAEGDFHVGHSDDLAAHIKERAAAVSWIDLSCCLQIKLAAQLPGLGAQDALGYGALQPQGTADSEDSLADGQCVGASHRHVSEFRGV